MKNDLNRLTEYSAENLDAAGKSARDYSEVTGKKGPRKRPKHLGIKIFALVLAAVLLTILLIPGFGGNLVKKIANNTALMYKAKVLKSDIKVLGESIKEQDVNKAEITRQKVQQDVIDVREILGNKFWSAAGAVPPAKDQINDVKTVLDLVDEADTKIIGPLLSIMEEYPLSDLKTDEGLNDAVLLNYLRFIEDVVPEAKDLAIRLKPLDLSKFDSSGSFKKIMDSMDDIIALLDIAEDADDKIISPLLPIMEEYPLSELRSEDGLSYAALVKYARLFERVLPKTKELIARTREIDLSKFVDNESAAEYSKMLDETAILLEIAEKADEPVIDPTLSLVENYPISDLWNDKGINAALILNYLNLFETLLPELNELAETLKAQDFSLIGRKIPLSEYIEKLGKVLDLGNEVAPYLPVLKCVLGNGSDTNILLVAQCMSEMRSTGGFPGQMGTVEIKDGVLNIYHFRSVWKVMPDRAPESAGITAKERKLFVNFDHPRDAVFCPDFERVAGIWVEGYKERQNGTIDSVVAFTPVVIQKLLSFLGSIELVDGTVMDGENAVRVLGRDLYFKYFSKNSGYSYKDANSITDSLYREAAEKTLNLAISGIGLSSLSDYFSVFIDGINDRSIQIWVADEEVQQFIREQGWNTHLNSDENKPEIAVFFNSAGGGCKNTWFLDIDTELSEAAINPDGTRSYNVKVSFSNVMTKEESSIAGRWIKGVYKGIKGYVLFFAPSGGTIGDYVTGFEVQKNNYEGLDVGCMWVDVLQSRPIVIRFTVTTAPGVETVPVIITNQTNTVFR